MSFNRNQFAMLVCGISALFIVGILSINSGSIRQLLFVSLFLVIVSFAILYKERIISFLIIYLAIMGFFRRALIPVADWSGFDPLLILGPGITLVIALIIFWEDKRRYPIQKEKPDKLMVTLLFFGCAHIFNPFSGSPLSGIIASMYIIIPWVWYFIAFYRISKNTISKVFITIEVVGTLIALYGIYQSFYGLLPFEMKWVEITGYAALYLAENTVRAIGTFPSAQEFVFFTMITFMIGFTNMVIRRRYMIHLPVILITLTSIFLASSRTIMFFIALAVFMVLIVTRKNLITKVITTTTTIVVFISIWFSLPFINPGWFGAAEPAVDHMIAGLVDPLSEDQTGLGHIERFVDGMKSIISNPVGYGIGSVTKAADKSASTNAMSTEVDISSMIVAMGVGGIVYILVILFTLIKTYRLIDKYNQTEYVIALGIFIGSLGQWVNGGFYLAPIIIWLLVGWIHKEHYRYRGEKNALTGS